MNILLDFVPKLSSMGTRGSKTVYSNAIYKLNGIGEDKGQQVSVVFFVEEDTYL